MPIPYKLIALIVLALSLVAGARYIGYLRDRLEQAETALEASERVRATLVARASQKARQEATRARRAAQTEKVLERHREFGDTPVPQEVQDDLCKTLRCARPDGVQHGADGSP